MEDHPDLQRLGKAGEQAHEKLVQAKANAINLVAFVVLMAAVPCIVWLWTWAL